MVSPLLLFWWIIEDHCFWYVIVITYTAQKKKFSSKDFFSKCDQIRSLLRIWSHLLKKSLMESFIFCALVCREITFQWMSFTKFFKVNFLWLLWSWKYLFKPVWLFRSNFKAFRQIRYFREISIIYYFCIVWRLLLIFGNLLLALFESICDR